MAYENDVLTRNDNDELAVRVVQSTEATNNSSYNDVLTYDTNGKLAVRVVGAGGGDAHNKGYFATQSALETAYPTAEAGDYAIVGETDTVWIWDEDTDAWVDTDTKGEVTSVNGLTGEVELSAEDVGAVPQYSSMPQPNQEGDIVQYVGTTNVNYTNGYFYKSVEDGQVLSDGVCVVDTESFNGGNDNEDLPPPEVTFDLSVLQAYLTSRNKPAIYDFNVSIVVENDGRGHLVVWLNYNPDDGNSVEVVTSGETMEDTISGLETLGFTADWTGFTYLGYMEMVLPSETEYGWERIDVQPHQSLKTVNGNSLIGSGNVELSTYLTYPAGWTTNSTTKAFCDGIAADTTAVKGKAYLGEVTFSDLPASMVNAEVVVEIMDGTTAQNKVIVLSLKSGNVAPYAWQYVYWNGGSNVSGWKTWQEPLVSGTNIKTVNGTSLLGSGDITTEVIQVSSMPTASATELGKVYQFIGTTDVNYTHGYFYECVSDGATPPVYSWSQVDVMPAGSSLPSQTGNSGKFLTTDGTNASWSDKPLQNTATGTDALTILGTVTTVERGVNVGKNSQAGTYGTSIGYNATATGTSSSAVGMFANASGLRSTALGSQAEVSYEYAVAIGWDCKAYAAGAIQIGGKHNVAHTNSDANTFKVGNANGNFEMMSADGTIPEARLADTTNAAQGQVLTLDANNNAVWQTPSTAVTSTTATLVVANWSSNTQTVTVNGVTSSNVVIVSPQPLSASDYASAGILCTAQSANTLTFTCTQTPSNAIDLSIVIIG